MPASAPLASAATSAAVPPPAAVTTAATSPSTSGASAQDDAVAGRVVEQIEGELGAEQRAAQVEQDDDAVRTVDAFDRFLHLDGVGAQRRLVQARGDRDVRTVPVQHLLGEFDRGPRERSAV